MSTRVDQTQQVNIAKPSLQGVECSVEMPVSIMSSGLLGAIDKSNINNKRDAIYKQIESICEEYRMNLNEVKNAQLLETLLGCTSEELVNKTQEEIDLAILALKDALGPTGHWKLFWQDRTREDIDKVAEIAIEKKKMRSTGVNFFEKICHQLTTEKTLVDELVKNGYIKEGETVSQEALKNYFRDNCKALKTITPNSTPQDIEKAKSEALEEFGKLSIRYKSLEEAQNLVSIVEELFADQRNKGLDLLINQYGLDKDSESAVAYRASQEMVGIVGTEDRTGISMTGTAATQATTTVYSSMNGTDSEKALQNDNERLQEILRKAPGERTQAEQNYVDSLKEVLSGTVCGLASNSKASATQVEKAIEQARALGISEDEINSIVQNTYGKTNVSLYKQYQDMMKQIETINKTKSNNNYVKSTPSKETVSNTETTSSKTVSSNNTPSRVISAINTNATNPIVKVISNIVKNDRLFNLAKNDLTKDINVELKTRSVDLPTLTSPDLKSCIYKGESLSSYIEANNKNLVGVIKDAFNMFNELPSEDQKTAIAYYTQLNEDDQTAVLENVGTTALGELLNYTSNKTIQELEADAKTFGSYGKDMVERKQEYC